MRNVIEYLRRKQGLTILDLTLDICSESMYYKYIAGNKNLSSSRVTALKDRLGADVLTEEELIDYQKELKNVLLNIIKFTNSYDSFMNSINHLHEIENQLLLTDELVIDYLIVKAIYLYTIYDINEYLEIMKLLDNFYNSMNDVQKAHYYLRYLLKTDIDVNNKITCINKLMILLSNLIDKSNIGYFYLGIIIACVNIKKNLLALNAIELAKNCFRNDLNFYGLIKTVNIEAALLIEQERCTEAIEILKDNLVRCSQTNSGHEEFLCLVNLVGSNSYLNNISEIKKYLKKIIKILDNQPKYITLGNYAATLLLITDYHGIDNRMLIKLVKENCDPNDMTYLNHLCIYLEIEDETDKMEYLFKQVIPNIKDHVTFNHYQFLVEKLISYFEGLRKYKIACNLKAVYMNEFKSYYFNR